MDKGQKRVPGANPPNVPAREATILGLGAVEEGASAAPAAPIVSVTPTRERTALGVGGAPEAPVDEPPPALDRSIAVDLVARKKPVEHPPSSEPPAAEPAPGPQRDPEPEPVARRRRRWPLVLLLLVVVGAAVGTYAMRDRIPWRRLQSLVARVSGS